MLEIVDRIARQRLRARGFRSEFVPTSVGRMHALVAEGSGPLPPVVLLHGLSAAGHHFGKLLTRLRPHVQAVIAPDMPGHGFSETPRGDAAVVAMHAGVVEAMNRLIDRPAILFGSSMGGFAAVRYAYEHPDKVAGLVLCSPGGAAMDHDTLRDFLASFQLDGHRDALEFVDRFMARRTWRRPFLAWGVRKSMGHPHVEALLDAMHPDELLRPEHLEDLHMPILLLWGQAERVLPPEAYAFFRDHLPDHAEVERPPHYGHAPYLEHPECVLEKLLSFVRRAAPHAGA